MSDVRIVPKSDVDWAHWEATSEHDPLSERCPFCPSLTYFRSPHMEKRAENLGPLERNLVFHYRRSDYRNEAGVGPLCLFCQHLDPGNLFGKFRRDGLVPHCISIVLGTLAELEARRQCAFCHIVLCTVRAASAVHHTKEEPISGDCPITITVHKSPRTLIKVSFDKGPWTFMAVKRVLSKNDESVPEVDQFVGSSISWKQIRQWIDSCSTEHAECLPTGTGPSGMRLIDVRDRKVTPELNPRDCHAFVALSYVWGKNIDSGKCVLLKANTTQLEQTNGLGNLPKTIEDAMTICESLGQRFLWVDRLCIVQDDEAKKGHQIHAMADIFQSAILTIVAACGDSMESPIPGISTERQTFQSQVHIAGLQVTSGLPRLSRTLPRAPWSQRGWTYQESILSSRKLYFTDLEVWFVCDEDFQREDVAVEKSDCNDLLAEDLSTTQLRSSHWMLDYWKHLNAYSERSLTYQSDIYNAFAGVLTALVGEGKTLYGLPKPLFDEALLWRLEGDTPSWDIRDCTVAKQDLLCPSWAWSSINGAMTNGGDYTFGRYLVSLVLWSLVDENGNTETIDVKFEDFEFDSATLLIPLLFAWRGGCFETPLPNDLQEKLELDPDSLWQWASEDLPRRWPTRKEFWDELHSQASSNIQVPVTTSNHLRPGMLLTRTQTTHFRLGSWRENMASVEYFEVLNKHGDMAGAIEANELCLKSKAKGAQRLETTICELMALSLSRRPLELTFPGKDIDLLNQKGDVVLSNIAVKVLVISWNENSPIARRISIGWVDLGAWLEAERTWKTIVLE